ncbi:MAG: hypothetical protein WHV26_03490 [Spirochaetota bacterium]
MFVREQYIVPVVKRVFGQLAHQDFIILKQVTNHPSGLNIVQQLSYIPVIATGDVVGIIKTKESKAGFIVLGDVIIYVSQEQFDACNITMVDRINIGGNIKDGAVNGGIVFKIKEIKYDIFLGVSPIIALILEKIPWD